MTQTPSILGRALGRIVTVAALVVAASSVAGAQSAARYTSRPCPELPPVFPAVPEDAECGTLTVPESRSVPNGRTIDLTVAIVPAESSPPRPDPIVWIAGGPGDDALTEIGLALEGKLNRDRDVIFMSQRGTYTADPSLTCPEVDRFGAETIAQPYDGDAARRAYAKATLECKRRVTALGIDLSAYNTLESVTDLEDLRTALGIDKWNVFGISYGTDYTLTYLRTHPQSIRAAGIDGVFPPPLAGGVSAWTSAGEGINAVFRACGEQEECRERYGDIGATFKSLVQRYERNPKLVRVKLPDPENPAVEKTVSVMISGGMLVQWAVSPGTHLAFKVPAAVDALARGDGTVIARMWADGKLNPATVGILGNGLFYGVSCGEWVPYESERDVIAAGRRAFPTFPLSIHRNAPNLQFMRSNCAVWNVPPVSPSIRDVTASDVPTLVMSAQYDAQTAPSFGPLVAQTLPNATVVQIPNIAHVAVGSPSSEAKACAQQIVRDYFEVLGNVDTSCIASVPPTDFEITRR